MLFQENYENMFVAEYRVSQDLFAEYREFKVFCQI